MEIFNVIIILRSSAEFLATLYMTRSSEEHKVSNFFSLSLSCNPSTLCVCRFFVHETGDSQVMKYLMKADVEHTQGW